MLLKSSCYTRLWSPVSNSQLVIFRIFFGLVMAGQCLRWLLSGWVTEMYAQPGYNFTFIGFEWLNVLHGSGMYYYFAGMGVLSLFVSAGLFYRFSGTVLALLYTAIYFSCKTHYNNHYYLMLLLCWLMVVMPAGKRFSLDVQFKFKAPSDRCYRWQLLVFIFQVACMYVFAGIAKINLDWLHAIPMETWLHGKTGRPFIGWTLRHPLAPWIVAYGGLLFDLLIVPGMLYRKTRIWFLLLALAFHVFNGIVFQIGSFPFMAMSLMVFFLPPAWFDKFLPQAVIYPIRVISPDTKRWTSYALAVYIMLQLFLPVRHWLIKGPVSWTEEGHRMAWQMMLRSKRGSIYFTIKNKQTDSSWTVAPESFVNKESLREVAVLPDVTWQAANFLQQRYSQQGVAVAVYAHSRVSLNFKPEKPLIDSTVNLARVQWNYWGHNKWIVIGD